MKTILDPSEWGSVLARYRGATAQLWDFQVSLKRLVLRLSRSESEEALYVTSIGCEHIVAPFSWGDASIVIVEQTSDGRTRVTDQGAGFELVCSGASLAVAPVDEPFEHNWSRSDE
jgi:hypothetical protein